jgi:uncharacterized protein with PIN domain
MFFSFMKCEICKKKIAELFLDKIKGTIIYDKKNKKRFVCFECQKRLGSKDNILSELNK